MKKSLLIPPLLLLHTILFAQKLDSIYFDLYTDSLKKGTFNYINVVGKLSNGNYRPLDSMQLIFTSSYGKFQGNSLWIPFDTKVEKVTIQVQSRQNPSQTLRHTIFIKKHNDDAPLKTMDEIQAEPPQQRKKRRS